MELIRAIILKMWLQMWLQADVAETFSSDYRVDDQ